MSEVPPSPSTQRPGGEVTPANPLAPPSLTPPTRPQGRALLAWLLGGLVVALALTAGALWLQRTHEREAHRSTYRELQAIADLKADQIAHWFQERLADAQLVQATPYAVRRALDVLARPEDHTTRTMFTAWLDRLMASGHYPRVLLLDDQFRVRLVHPPTATPHFCETIRTAAQEAARSHAIQLADLHRTTDDGAVHLDLIVPLLVRRDGSGENVPAAGLPPSPNDRTAALLVFEVGVENRLFPLLQRITTPRLSTETLLVRRDHDTVLYLNELRFRPGSALHHRLPLSQTNLLAVAVALGHQGPFRGPDYRHVEVLAASRSVPQLPWSVIAKTDAEEALGPWRTNALTLLGTFFLALALIAVLLTLAWHRKERFHYQAVESAAATIREHSTLLRLAGSLARLGGWRADLTSQHVAWSNEVAAIHDMPPGYSPSLAEGIAFYAPEWRDRIQTVFTACARDGTPYDEEMEILTRQGRRRWVRTLGEAVRNPAGQITHVQGAFQDITDRKQATAALQDAYNEVASSRRALASMVEDLERTARQLRVSETQYRTLFEANPHCMWIYDLESLRFLAVNETAVTRYGYSRQEFLALTIEDIRPPEELPRLRHNLNTTTAVLQQSGVWQHRRKDGETIFVEIASHALTWEGRPARLVLAHDVSERERARQALEASERRFRQAITDAPFPIILHAEDGEILQLSQSWCELSGYTAQELPTVSDWIAHACPDRQEPVRKRIQALYRLDRRQHDGDLPIRTRSGETRVWDFSSAPLGRLPDGRRVVLSMAMDVTDRRAAEDRLEAARASLLSVVEDQREAEAQVRRLNTDLEQRVRDRTAQLEAANRELEAFSYSVSHDLRAPLRAINGYARILAEDHAPQLNAEGQRVLGVVRSEALRMGELIDDLLRLSRLGRQALRLSPTDMTALVREVFDQLTASLPERPIEFHLADLPAAPADATLLRQVWVNLLENALKYSSLRPSTRIEVTGQLHDGEAVYAVRDNGTGFDMKYVSKLFGVFQRLHSPDEFEGTGVGLALVQRLIHRHGGRVWAEGVPEQGATFHFTLPVAPGRIHLLTGGTSPPVPQQIL